MKNPFLKAAKLFGGNEPQMIARARKWKPLARTDPPRAEDFPILLWRHGRAEGWEICRNPDPVRKDLEKSDTPFVWFSLPKE